MLNTTGLRVDTNSGAELNHEHGKLKGKLKSQIFFFPFESSVSRMIYL